jgi:hypothetical protein
MSLCRPSFWLSALLVSSAGLAFFSPSSSAFDDAVYNNLLKSRDALTSQKSDLETAYDETKRQMDALNAKLVRIDSYLRQINVSLKDVDTALMYARQ